jgi:hypothetical protein
MPTTASVTLSQSTATSAGAIAASSTAISPDVSVIGKNTGAGHHQPPGDAVDHPLLGRVGGEEGVAPGGERAPSVSGAGGGRP